MTDANLTRRCGHCGEAVGSSDIVCLHCDALLAAYEAPVGATAGSSAAVLPVDSTTPSPPPITPPTYAAPPVQLSVPDSPIATAVEETKAAEAAEPASPDRKQDDPEDEAWPISSTPISETLAAAVDLTNLPESIANQMPAPSSPSAPSPVGETLAETRAKVETPPASPPKPAPRQAPRSAPARAGHEPVEYEIIEELRAPVAGSPRLQTVDPATEGASSQKRGSSSSSGSIWFIVIALFIIFRIPGSTAMTGFVITIGAIMLVVWFVNRTVQATGRKTTTMPWDDQARRRR